MQSNDKKLSYRRGTARCVVSVEILPIATQQRRNYLNDKSLTDRQHCNLHDYFCRNLVKISRTDLRQIFRVARTMAVDDQREISFSRPLKGRGNIALRLHINVSLNRPPDRTWRRPPGRPRNKWLDELRNNSTRPTGELWRRAVDRGHGGATTRRPSPATRQ